MFNYQVYIIVNHIEKIIAQHENTAEEYFQEIGDEERGNEYLAKAAELKEVLQWIQEKIKTRQTKKIS